MNNPNPLVPQGSLLEQKGKGKPHLRIAIFIVAIHVVFLGGLLMQGCKRDTPPAVTSLAPTNDLSLPPLDTNLIGIATPPSSTAPSANPAPAGPGGSPTGLIGLPPLEPVPSTPEPAPAVTPSPAVQNEPAAGGTTAYIIRKGDTLAVIAKKHKITLRALTDANPGVNPSRLKVGQSIQLPIPPTAGGAAPAPMMPAVSPAGAESVGTYQVKTGDTLTRIAKLHGTTIKALRALNNLKTDRINVGQRLKVPGGKPPAMSVESAPGGGLAPPETGGITAPSPAPAEPGLAPIPSGGTPLGTPPR